MYIMCNIYIYTYIHINVHIYIHVYINIITLYLFSLFSRFPLYLCIFRVSIWKRRIFFFTLEIFFVIIIIILTVIQFHGENYLFFPEV